MIADSVKHFVHASISGALLWRRLDGFGSQRLLGTGIKAALASLVMAGFAVVTLPMLTELIGSASVLHEALLVGICALLYGGVFLLAARMLKIGRAVLAAEAAARAATRVALIGWTVHLNVALRKSGILQAKIARLAKQYLLARLTQLAERRIAEDIPVRES